MWIQLEAAASLPALTDLVLGCIGRQQQLQSTQQPLCAAYHTNANSCMLKLHPFNSLLPLPLPLLLLSPQAPRDLMYWGGRMSDLVLDLTADMEAAPPPPHSLGAHMLAARLQGSGAGRRAAWAAAAAAAGSRVLRRVRLEYSRGGRPA